VTVRVPSALFVTVRVRGAVWYCAQNVAAR
jgi:hypothetical protein